MDLTNTAELVTSPHNLRIRISAIRERMAEIEATLTEWETIADAHPEADYAERVYYTKHLPLSPAEEKAHAKAQRHAIEAWQRELAKSNA